MHEGALCGKNLQLVEISIPDACYLQLWGYQQVEEIVWVKTNQLHRLIRTGRTGHWLNHSKVSISLHEKL